jgi:hypothetical protein
LSQCFVECLPESFLERHLLSCCRGIAIC